MSLQSAVQIEKLNKIFHSPDKSLHVLNDIHLIVKKGEFVTIIGPSGCGKSTLLKIVAGLDVAYEGTVQVGEHSVQGPSKEKGVIFQEHRLFPWLTVEKNIAADLSLRNPEVRERVDQVIRLVRLNGFERAYPKEISGGMSQRVAIARALLRQPEVLLLDEPFGALDAFTRSHMQESLLDIWRENGTTMLLVTHDIDEAVFLSNRIVIMDIQPGRIKQVLGIDLPYPRKRVSPSFQEYRQAVLSALESSEPLEDNWEI